MFSKRKKEVWVQIKWVLFFAKLKLLSIRNLDRIVNESAKTIREIKKLRSATISTTSTSFEWNLWQKNKKLLRRNSKRERYSNNKTSIEHMCLLYCVVFSTGLFWEFFRIWSQSNTIKWLGLFCNKKEWKRIVALAGSFQLKPAFYPPHTMMNL